jgi:hypothetical protein
MDFTALNAWVFATIFLFSFALFLLITGAFTAYFGSGKSRKIGAGLLITGLLIGILIALLRYMGYWGPGSAEFSLLDVVVQTIVVVLAVIIGAGLAIGLFLLAIMKS